MESNRLIRVNNDVVKIAPATKKGYTLAQVQTLVGDGKKVLVEIVKIIDDKKNIMLVDEEGRLKGLPPNMVASLITGHLIAGTAIVIPSRLFK
jgi:hypothetical protein